MHRFPFSEKLAWLGFVLLVIGLPAGLFSLGGAGRAGPVVEVHARMSENGGWSPGSISTVVGEPLRLRLVSDDVLHSFAIGQGDDPPIDLEPGVVKEITLTFDRPGKYTFYCTRWCGANHWRMRGTIEVTGTPGASQPAGPPLYLQLGLDLDRPHPAEAVPAGRPSAARAASLVERLPVRLRGQAFWRTHSPAEVFRLLQADPALEDLNEAQVWDLVAYLWTENTSPAKLAEGRVLYAQNCAACHGETGAGDGVIAAQLSAADRAHALSSPEMAGEHGAVEPTDFTNPNQMLGASPALLQGKILRGGMGTGMPYWGPIFSDDQIWSLVDYLWSFQFSDRE